MACATVPTRFVWLCASCSIEKQRTSDKPSSDALWDAHRIRVSSATDSTRKGDHPNSVVSPMCTMYPEVGHGRLWSLIWLPSSSATAHLTKQANWLLLKFTQRHGVCLRHRAKRKSCRILSCHAIEAICERRLISNQDGPRRFVLDIEPNLGVGIICMLAPVPVRTWIRCFASHRHQTSGCRHTLATSGWRAWKNLFEWCATGSYDSASWKRKRPEMWHWKQPCSW